jgi:hypothetical protein
MPGHEHRLLPFQETMADEFDRNILSGLLQTGLQISLGAAQKSLDMLRNPPESVLKVASELTSMFTIPADTGPELQDKAQAMAGVWLQKGVTFVSECRTAGAKLTEEK